MLVLTRKQNEKIVIAGDIEVVVVEAKAGKVRRGIVAPPHVPIHRKEVQDRISADDARRAAAENAPPADRAGDVEVVLPVVGE